ncbi:MAG: putative bifunctional diguanylate cyclase/phosphodiesterase, partial [Tumebacillaceae bacterium]
MNAENRLTAPALLKQYAHLRTSELNGVLTLDATSRIATCNESCAALFGYRADALIGQSISLLLPFFDLDINQEQQIARHLDGTEFPVETEITKLPSEPPLYVCVVHDRGRGKQIQHTLQLTDTIFDMTQEGVMITDTAGVIQYVNPAFSVATGYSLEEAVGQTPRLLQSGWHAPEFYQAMWRTLVEEGNWMGEIWNRRNNGEIYPQWLSITAIHDENGHPIQYAAVLSDLSKNKQHDNEVHYLSYHDPLTGLPNLELFIDRLAIALTDSQRLDLKAAVLYVGLDRFKLINDTLGHNTGDQLLQTVAGRLLDAIPDGATVARLGKDEFAMIMENIAQAEESAKLAQKILDLFIEPFVWDGQEYFITASIGIAVFPEDGLEVDALMANADSAMSRAKRIGNNFQHYTPAMNAQSLKRLELENDLFKAIQREEFVVYYQPQLSIATGELIGMEALVRWKHSTRGLISPAEFIPLAEETGLIVPIGEHVLRTACEQSVVWQQKGYTPVRLAVNLSARQFHQRNLVDVVSDVLQETGLDPNLLELEITESCTMEDVDRAIQTLHKLKHLGVQISIDDFGTGYSSFAYLTKFPIQTLKIDKSFVGEITENPDGAAITSSIIAMAH